MCISSWTSSQGVEETSGTPGGVLSLVVTMSTHSSDELPYGTGLPRALPAAHYNHQVHPALGLRIHHLPTSVASGNTTRASVLISRISILFRASKLGLSKSHCFLRTNHPLRVLSAVYLLQPSSRYGPDLRSSPGRMSKVTLPSGKAQQRL